MTKVDTNWPKLTKVCQSSPKFTQIDPRVPKLTDNDPSWHKLTQIDPSWPKITQNYPKWQKLTKNYPTWLKLTKVGSKLTQVTQKLTEVDPSWLRLTQNDPSFQAFRPHPHCIQTASRLHQDHIQTKLAKTMYQPELRRRKGQCLHRVWRSIIPHLHLFSISSVPKKSSVLCGISSFAGAVLPPYQMVSFCVNLHKIWYLRNSNSGHQNTLAFKQPLKPRKTGLGNHIRPLESVFLAIST